jgi:hypothetical protein
MREGARARSVGVEAARSHPSAGGAASEQARFFLSLQRSAGNRAVAALVQRLHGGGVVQRTPDKYTHQSETGGALEVKVDDSGVQARGWIGKMIAPTGFLASLRSPSLERVPLTGSIDFHVDADDGKRLVIGTIKSQPKRTGAGTILVYHMAKYALGKGYTIIGTDLSALEEGTPEFYESIGLRPAQASYDSLAGLQIDPASRAGKNILWAGRLDGNTDAIFNKAAAKLTESQWQT